MLNYPNIGDVVHLKRFNEPAIFGIVVGYTNAASTDARRAHEGGTLVKIEWFDGLTSSEYSYRLEVQNV